MKSIDEKSQSLFLNLRNLKSVVVAFSGGVDSTFLLWMAVQALGKENVLAATAVSPSLASSEFNRARDLAKLIGAEWEAVKTDEMEISGYKQNGPDRCMYCKGELYSKLKELADKRGFENVVDGTNADDVRGYRPGMKALKELNIPCPLKDAELMKEEIRTLSKKVGLPTWNKPAKACLASRIPYGEEITIERLKRVEEAEGILLDLGFEQLRVRDHYPIARIEIDTQDIPKLLAEDICLNINSALKKIGYKFVTLDLAGFHSGSMNALIEGDKND